MRKPRTFVGTSGFNYSWNPDGLEWYLLHSGLNALEINMPFYRFPFPAMVKSWRKKTLSHNPSLRWVVKVNQKITHVYKFNEKAFRVWERFFNLFSPLDELIDFYLFQLPPSFLPTLHQRIESFVREYELGERFALEPRNVTWFQQKWLDWARKLGITWVSVDAPTYTELPRNIYVTSEFIYLRVHGRTEWYSHYYTDEELVELVEKLKEAYRSHEKVKGIYVFFNNDHAMLENARRMRSLLSSRF